jgi:ribosomal protein S18 acetylase RimI-like enzyme
MNTLAIRKYQPNDLIAVKEITYRTGFKGEDLTGRNFIDDKYLFFLIFIGYYPRYEPEHFFVSTDTHTNDLVGFICGTPDTAAQGRRFRWKIIPRLIFRGITCTTWRYPRTLKMLFQMSSMRHYFDAEVIKKMQTEYPAHLHINILSEYQRIGLGTRLIHTFEEHLENLGVSGVHLETSNHNKKAVLFYKKMGYTIVYETKVVPHPVLDDLRFIGFAKRLES